MKKIVLYLKGYLRRPYLWIDLVRQPFRLLALRHPREDTRERAYQWASSKAVKPSEAVDKITGGQLKIDELFERHSSALQVAEQRVGEQPVRLGGGGAIDLIYSLVRWKKPSFVVETGVASGWSSLAVLLALKDNEMGFLVSVDRPDMRVLKDDIIGAAVLPDLYDRWTLLRGVDRDNLPRALGAAGDALEFFHYDSDKSYFGRKWAYRKA